MNNSGKPGATQANIARPEALAELERVLADPSFHCSERNKKFLRYIVAETLEGRGQSLKGYSIAVDVFGRPDDFNAASDGIVRIEATRLRAALNRYYSVGGGGHRVEIHLPKGHYAPEFVRSPQEQPSDSDTVSKIDGIDVRHHVTRTAFSFSVASGKTMLTAGTLAVVATLLLVLYWHQTLVKISGKPIVSVELIKRTDGDSKHAELIRDAFVIAISRFNTLRLSADAYTSNTGLRTSSDGRISSRYQILLKPDVEAGSRSVWWQVVDRDSGEVVRAGEERIPVDEQSPAKFDERLVARLAVRLASIRGVINSIETARDLDAPSLGNGCVLRAGLAFNTRTAELLANARSCLERTLKLRPYDADAHAMLAAVLLASEAGQTSAVLADVARDHANQAVSLAPESDRSYMAQMISAFHDGRLEVAKQAGERAIALNPYNPAATGKYSSVLVALGEWDKAAPVAEKTELLDDAPQADAERTLALDAYRRGAYDEAITRIERIADNRCVLSQLLLAAALARQGDRDEAAQLLRFSGTIGITRSDASDYPALQRLPAALRENVKEALRLVRAHHG